MRGWWRRSTRFAERYLKGDGVLHNKIEAGRWFLRAAERGYAPSQSQLAGLHLFGLQASSLDRGATGLFAQDDSTAPDYPAALAWSTRAAEAGDVDAQAMLAYIYTSGPAELRDEGQAEHWYAKAAAGESAQGKLGLGLILLRRADTAELTFAAVDLIRAAADAGLPTAHYYLGLIYERRLAFMPI